MRVTGSRSLVAALAMLLATTTAEAQVRATLVASGLASPVGLVAHPSEPTVLLVLEQAGRIRVLRDGQVQTTDFLDLTSQIASGGEQGLLGLAFSPDFATSGRVFVSFTNRSGHSVIARFSRLASDPLRVDPATRFDLRWPDGRQFIEQPFSNHNGGHIAFGPDGYLYIGMGDGGSGNDPMHLAQNPLSLLGKMLRLDVSVGASDPEGYNVPSSNPFVGRSGVLPEVWSFGLRNPWRWSFDDPRRGGTGAMVIGDVGQNTWEEIDYEPAGAGGRNYGWRNREGAHENVTTLAPFSTPLRDPIYEYGRNTGRSITGGYVYRGQALGTSFTGRYFFADFVTSRVWSIGLSIAANGEASAQGLADHSADLGNAASSPASFGIDSRGELYLVNYGGAIYRIDSTGASPATRRGDAPAVGTAKPRR